MPLTAPFLNNKCMQIVLKITKLSSVMNSATLKLRASSGKEPAYQRRRHIAETPILWPPDAKS